MTEKYIKIMSIAGARPNFMKLAAIAHAIKKNNDTTLDAVKIKHTIVHTGQHYDGKMSTGFFKELNIPEPDVNLEVGSASHAVQTAEIMKRFEPVLLAEEPDVLLVVGDVNSTIACTLVASKIEYPANQGRKRPVIVHVEAGLRSGDREMPEEVNRVLTDALSDLLFVTEQSGLDNLAREGVAPQKVRLVGNVMIDTLITHLAKARKSDVQERLSISQSYALVTLHRPSNVDARHSLEKLVQVLKIMSKWVNIVFPVHPRTKAKLEEYGFYQLLKNDINILLTQPLGYIDFLNLVSSSKVVVTDSGGIQEETTYLQVPCITLRENTERPITVEQGSNYLIGTKSEKLLETVQTVLRGDGKKSEIPKLWDGLAGERIVSEIISFCKS